MANKSNAELWVDIKNLRIDNEALSDENEHFAAEMKRLETRANDLEAKLEIAELEMKRLKKELDGSITQKKLQTEKRIAFNRGFEEGRGRK